ncbi:MAG: protein kinase [Gemmatirosa sp.]|nr:protein kinase [Gemmatirosa sp.]
MLRLTTFGGIQLRDEGEPHVGGASQRRRLAILTVVAAGGSQPVSRDKLVGLLWPETDAERARHALRQALHAIQQAVGQDTLFVGTSALQLDPAVITTDVQDLEAAADAGEHQRVVALYKGPFLDGFFVSDAPAFEHWVDAQRTRYAALYTAALEALAGEADARGDRAGAVAWWRRLAAEQPVSARYALRLMRALADAGDRTGAIQFAAVHQAVVRQELGIDPDPGVAELATSLRAGETGAPSVVREGAQVAAGLRADSARARARERQLAWLDRTLGSRYDVDVGAAAARSGAVVGYQAFDRARRVPVEIHLLDAGVAAVADVDVLRARLDRIAAIGDPHVARLYEHGQADGIVFYVVARPDGASLRDRIAREHQLPIADALSVARDVAAALESAHERDVMHGDLRPKYVWLTAAGAVVSGLGIVEAIMSATAHERTSTTLRLGSPAYQSPELLIGDPRFDARSDIYSFGCIVYEMLAGEVPYASASPTHMVSAKFSAPFPSLRARRESVSPALEAIVQRCIARSPSDRYRDARELRDALDALPADR